MTDSAFFTVKNKTFEIKGVSENDPYICGIYGKCESKFQDFCSAVLAEDSVALDIGANIGVTSIILSQFLSRGRIYSFEPGKTIFNLMLENLKRNGIHNVIGYNYAISNITKQISFIENSAYGHIDLSQRDVPNDNSVMAYSLDDLVEELKLDRVDFIKIDTEGFEPQCFAGARKTIERFNPVIYFELNTWCLMYNGKNNPLDFMESITNQFRYVFRVSKDDYSVLQEVDSAELHSTLVYDNIIRFGSVNDVVVSNDPTKMNLQAFSIIDKLPLPKEAYKAKISIENPPTSIKSGSKTKLKVKVKNISNTLWPFHGQPDGKFQINLGDHWLDKQGKIIVNDSSRASLPHDVEAGNEVTIEIDIIAPTTPGDYIVEYDMVKELITWFKDKGSKTTKVNIKVE